MSSEAAAARAGSATERLRGYRVAQSYNADSGPWWRVVEVFYAPDGGVDCIGRSVVEAPSRTTLIDEVRSLVRAFGLPDLAHREDRKR